MSHPKERFYLSREEKNSRLWMRLMSHFEERLALLRSQNDGDRSEMETAKIRGSIAEIKQFIALNSDLPIIDTPPL